MNAKPNPPPSRSDRTLRERAEAVRSAAARHSPPSLDARLDVGRSLADQFDFAPFSVVDLARLYELTRQTDEYWGQIGSMPLCSNEDGQGFSVLTNLGRFAEIEEHRMAFLRDKCVAEISRRVPANDAERDEILCVRIMHEIDCNGRVDRLDAPTLLVEALKAWG
ncbi:hypothetical protein [Methylobacterium sp. Leaf94]|uniref:hypothetical protein n=1 Tax=Methylobacterium sp. Leaf94 TaxID=1736250 RepID=UPI000AA38C4E|nr:hypothetical protein [Methylobacterium sp. Leaf94]